jgi:hypothetical protein
MFGLLRKKASSGDFWDWLRANTSRIQSGLGRDPHGIAEEVGQVFKRSYPDLVWEVSPNKSGPWLFCVSANGNRALFPQVLRAVRAAPEVPGWKVQAFRPRGPLTAEIDMGGRTLGYDDIWCSVEPLGDGIRVVLWVRGMTPELDRVLSPAVLILLDNAVGEYDAVMKIKQLDRGPLPPNPRRREDFFPLSELPRFLDGVRGESVGEGRT